MKCGSRVSILPQETCRLKVMDIIEEMKLVYMYEVIGKCWQYNLTRAIMENVMGQGKLFAIHIWCIKHSWKC